MNVDMEHALGAKIGIDRGLDAICGNRLGDQRHDPRPVRRASGPDVGLLGLLNQPNATLYTPAIGASGQQHRVVDQDPR